MPRSPLGALLALLALGLISLPLAARATTATCPPVRSNIEAAAEGGESADQISEALASCLPSPVSGSSLSAPYNQVISAPGGSSTTYEAIEACGYHPQRKEATCPVQIRQMTGYSGMICAGPGSWEFVLLCVDFGAGLVPINVNGFHVYDTTLAPNWDFAAVIQSNATLFDQQYVGQALPARAILSWMINPMVGPVPCNFVPVWGNRSDFRIRLDP
ncbi:MAG TPA: hypothetical protein VKY89_02705 [Thermoanaerobaculia bacterium]|jgi:hypothetical protein|nr:hypothetical protein [Thermoanaerobaculia bacterium]